MGFERHDFVSKFDKASFDFFVLSGDVGGTNMRLAVCGIKKSRPTLIFSFSFKSKREKDIHSPINEVIRHARSEFGIEIGRACIAVAGIVVDNIHDKATNLDLEVDARRILDNTSLNSVFLINDFEAVGYSINVLGEDDFHTIRKGKEGSKRPKKAVIGAGTGLGKSILIWDNLLEAYVPSPSEGGHSDFPSHSDDELALCRSIRKDTEGFPITYEDLLSGKGLRNIYKFVLASGRHQKTACSEEIEKVGMKSKIIMKSRDKDPACKETVTLFVKFYGRCARNFLLDSLSLGGVYIGGGIAANNLEIFDYKVFMKEIECHNKTEGFIADVPIKVIRNENAGLIGAAFAAAIRDDLALKR